VRRQGGEGARRRFVRIAGAEQPLQVAQQGQGGVPAQARQGGGQGRQVGQLRRQGAGGRGRGRVGQQEAGVPQTEGVFVIITARLMAGGEEGPVRGPGQAPTVPLGEGEAGTQAAAVRFPDPPGRDSHY